MKKPPLAISVLAFLCLALSWSPSASAQAEGDGEIPAKALVNLYEATQHIIKDPAADYRKGESPDFPRPSAVQAQWDKSMAAPGTSLSREERSQFVPCAAHLNAAITDMEIAYRIEISQPNNPPAQQSARQRRMQAPPEVEKCASAYKLAQSELVNSPSNKPH